MRLLFALLALSTLLVNAASSDDRRAISEMPIATNVLESAYFPLIQPYPGRTTNDNFRATVSTLFHGRFGETVTNLFVTNLTVVNLTVITNFTAISTNITAYEITVTNNISHDRIFISTNITINGFNIQMWTNENSIVHLTIDRGAGPLDYSFIVTTNNVQIGDNRMNGTMTWINKSLALNVGDNPLPVAGNSQWNLIGPTSNPDDTTISLMNGITDAQKLVIFNITNAVPANGAFKLTNGTPIPDSLSGGFTQLSKGHDWVATNGSWIILEFHSPNWVEIDDRNVFTGAGGADTWHVVFSGGVTNLQPVDSTLPVEIDSQLQFGGPTNVLVRSGSDLIYSNRFQYPTIQVIGSNAVPAVFGLNASTAGDAANVSGPKGVNLGWDVGQVAFYSSNSIPSIPINLGSTGHEFGDLHLGNTGYIYGYNQGNLIDYSRGALYHTGTNGAVVIDSQSSGTAGIPRQISLDWNGTNLWQFTLNGTSLQPLLNAHEPGSPFITTFGQVGGIGTILGNTLNISAANGDGFVIGGNTIEAVNSNGGLIQHFGYVTPSGSSSLDIRHTGTNGSAIINSVANGDAGNPRGLQFQNNGVIIMSLTNAASYSGTALIAPQSFNIQSGGNLGIGFYPNGSFAWQFDPNGHMIPAASATYSIGVDSLGSVNAAKSIAANTLIAATAHTPANSSETNYAGAIGWDNTYLYFWTATNVNKRIPWQTW